MTSRRILASVVILGVALALALIILPDASVISWVSHQQRQWHRQLAKGLSAVADGSQSTAFGLIGTSLIYGVLHAVGPGHGKAAIGAWLLTHPSRIGRGAALAAASAFLQGLVAILLVRAVFLLADRLPALSNDLAIGWSERVGFGLLIGIGAFTLWRGVSARNRRHDAHCHCHGGLAAERIAWTDLAGLVVAIGLRPCSGAVLVLTLAQLLDLVGAGIVAILAMSAGTAFSVTLLAVVTVKSRALALKLLNKTEHPGVARAGRIMGGAFLVALGLFLLLASFSDPHPLRL